MYIVKIFSNEIMCFNKQIPTISKQSDLILIVEENKIVMDIAQCFLLSHKVLLTRKEVDPSLLLFKDQY